MSRSKQYEIYLTASEIKLTLDLPQSTVNENKLKKLKINTPKSCSSKTKYLQNPHLVDYPSINLIVFM